MGLKTCGFTYENRALVSLTTVHVVTKKSASLITMETLSNASVPQVS